MKKRFKMTGKILLTMIIFIALNALGATLLSILEVNNSAISRIVSMTSMIIAPCLTYAMFERKSRWSMGIRQSFVVKETGQGVVLGILLISFSFLVIWLFNGLQINSIQYDSSTLQQVGISCGLFILVAFSEEILFRGYIQGLLGTHYGKNVAIIISSIVFALAHLMNPGILSTPIPLLNIFLIGVFFAVTREITGKIWIAIGFHFSWNFFQGNIYGFAVSGTENNTVISITSQGNSIISGGEFGAEGSILTTLIILILCFVTIRRNKSKTVSMTF